MNSPGSHSEGESWTKTPGSLAAALLLNIHIFIPSLIKHLLSFCCVTGTFLDAGDIVAMNETDINPGPHGDDIPGEEKDGKQLNVQDSGRGGREDGSRGRAQGSKQCGQARPYEGGDI